MSERMRHDRLMDTGGFGGAPDKTPELHRAHGALAVGNKKCLHGGGRLRPLVQIALHRQARAFAVELEHRVLGLLERFLAGGVVAARILQARAQAQLEDLTIVTSDAAFDDYDVKVLAARS